MELRFLSCTRFNFVHLLKLSLDRYKKIRLAFKSSVILPYGHRNEELKVTAKIFPAFHSCVLPLRTGDPEPAPLLHAWCVSGRLREFNAEKLLLPN